MGVLNFNRKTESPIVFTLSAEQAGLLKSNKVKKGVGVFSMKVENILLSHSQYLRTPPPNITDRTFFSYNFLKP